MLAPCLILLTQTGSQAFAWFVGLKEAICRLFSRLVFTRWHTQNLKGEKDHFAIPVSFLKHSWPYPCHASSRLCQVRGTSTNQNKKRKDNENSMKTLRRAINFQDLRKELWQIWCCLSCNFQPDSEIKRKCAERAVLRILILRLNLAPLNFRKSKWKYMKVLAIKSHWEMVWTSASTLFRLPFPSMEGGRGRSLVGAWLRLGQLGYHGSKSCTEHKSHQAKSLSSPAVQGFVSWSLPHMREPFGHATGMVEKQGWKNQGTESSQSCGTQQKRFEQWKKQLVHPKKILVGWKGCL